MKGGQSPPHHLDVESALKADPVQFDITIRPNSYNLLNSGSEN